MVRCALVCVRVPACAHVRAWAGVRERWTGRGERYSTARDYVQITLNGRDVALTTEQPGPVSTLTPSVRPPVRLSVDSAASL